MDSRVPHQPKYQRRKEDRPQEITEAAFEVFAEKGYAAARVEEVAQRAGVSKGLTYLYFKTKEELFKAVVKSVVVRRVDALVEAVDTTELSSEEFIRSVARIHEARSKLAHRHRHQIAHRRRRTPP